jgi:predicted PurR-regulated permease PerM
MTIMVAVAATAIAIWGLKAIAGFVGPAILAIVLLITVYPIRSWLERLHVPGVLASLATVLAVYAIIAAILVALALSINQLINLVPNYTNQFNHQINDAATWLRHHGISQGQIDKALSKLDIGQLVPVLQSLAGRVLSLLTNLLLFALLVLFAAFDAPGFVKHLRADEAHRGQMSDALTEFARGVRRYFAVSAGFGLVCAALNTAALYVINVPAAFTWGLLSFVTNFVPQVGFLVGLVPPAVLALLNGGVSQMIWVIIAYVAINFVVQSLIQPKVFGDALGLTATIAFGSLIFWAYVLGPLGAILALPMTLLVKAIFVDSDPSKAWLEPLLSGNDAVPDSSTPAPSRPRAWWRLLR